MQFCTLIALFCTRSKILGFRSKRDHKPIRYKRAPGGAGAIFPVDFVRVFFELRNVKISYTKGEKMSGGTEGGGVRIIDKVIATLHDLMDHEDAAVRLEAVKLALGATVKIADAETAGDVDGPKPSLRGQPGRSRGRRGGEE